MDLLTTVIVLAMGIGCGLYAGRTLWHDPVTKHCRHRHVEGIYGDERNHTEPFVLRCTLCGTLVTGGLDEVNWPPRSR